MYEIDLERCTTSAMLLDYLFQIAGKCWGDDAVIQKILECIEDICWEHLDDMGYYCSGSILPGGCVQNSHLAAPAVPGPVTG